MIRKRYIVGLVAAAALTLAAVIGVAAQTGGSATPTPSADDPFITKLAANLGVSPEKLRAALQQTATQLVDEGVASGRIPADRAAALKQRIAEGKALGFGKGPGVGHKGMRHGGAGWKLGGPNDIAAIIGVDAATLRTELESGKTLAQIAEAHGKSGADVKAALVAIATERLDKLVAEGKITAEQKQSMLDQLSARIDKLLDATHTPGH